MSPKTINIPFETVGFDLDGTLLDTFRDLGAAVNHALALGGFAPVPMETSQDLIGGGAKIMLAQAVNAQGGLPGGLEGDDFRSLYKAMLRFYSENTAVSTKPYPHAREAVAGLARAAKVPVIAAAYGYCDAAPAELGADAVIDSLDQLIPALEALPAKL